jgi:hypothetical protein
MAAKKKNSGKKKGKIKVLKLKKETVKNLTSDEARRVKGGQRMSVISASVPLSGYSA